MSGPHDPDTCPACAPYVNTTAYQRGVKKARAMAAQRVTDDDDRAERADLK